MPSTLLAPARLRLALVAPSALLVAAGGASAQSRYLFSIDWQGPTVGLIAPPGAPITEGDILVPNSGASLPALGVPAPPAIAIPHGAGGLGLLPGCAGHPGGTPCIAEVDAFSRGADFRFRPNVPVRRGQIVFSVDEYAVGLPVSPLPSLTTEAPVGDSSADAFVNLGTLPPPPLAPAISRHVAVQDGDALPSGSGVTYPGVGVREPNPPLVGPVNPGDNLDALDVLEPVPGAAVGLYFSLDFGRPDPLDGVPNANSAAAHGFSGGDVLRAVPGGPPVMYAPAPLLGLDLVGGPNSDDLDALILWENGAPGYAPSQQPYQWVGGNTDMLIFSVRRGSAVIGMPDSIFGLPIQEGDLLVPPVPTFLGGVSSFPGIFVAAENLGLATTRPGGGAAAVFADDLCAADALHAPLFDCDQDGIEDAIAIALFGVVDANADGVPDVCQASSVGTPSCFCTPAVAPCGNAFPLGGCLNVSGTGAILSGSGSASVALDNLLLTTSGMNPGTFALTFLGTVPIAPAPAQNGLLCARGQNMRFPPYPTGPGTASLGTGIVALSGGFIGPFQTFHFQTWYRDVVGPCGALSNFSNALSVTFVP